ncbi:hypothetical protein VNN36_07730 [Lactococcus garvieae]|uniref:hypothetical protein n=1 Tax=Lactococcus garvieae TaxID=1363 RepID=UPI0030D4967B
MSSFYIEKLIAQGKEKIDAEVRFQPGLNIITGPSNSGKSMIADCIDYLFGGNDVPFVEEETGYTSLSLVIQHPTGTYTLHRQMNTGAIHVSHQTSERLQKKVIRPLSTGKFNTRSGSKDNISKFWLELIGIKEEHHIIKNSSYVTQKLGWRTFSHSLLIDEDHIIQKPSILLPRVASDKTATAYLSSLLFLLYGKDFSEYHPIESTNERKIRRMAVSNYITENLDGLIKERENLLQQYQTFESVDIETEVEEMVQQLTGIEFEINTQIEKSQTLFEELITCEEELAQKQHLLERYDALARQYLNDIERLSFIVSGERVIDDHHHQHSASICPFCEGELPEQTAESYLEMAQAELTQILLQVKDLEPSRLVLLKEINTLKTNLHTYQSEEKKLNQLIDQELKPKASQLTHKLEQYHLYIQIQEQLASTTKLKEKYDADRNEIINEKRNTQTYKPKEQFEANFWEIMAQTIKEILEACHYETPLHSVQFSSANFDMVLNQLPKKSNQGKGYRAFLNTILCLAYRKLLQESGVYDPSLMIIDTPLLGLDEGERAKTSESMQKGLFTYFMNHQKEGQLIIIENSNELPQLDYKKHKVNEIVFTHDKNQGRFGFLHDI